MNERCQILLKVVVRKHSMRSVNAIIIVNYASRLTRHMWPSFHLSTPTTAISQQGKYVWSLTFLVLLPLETVFKEPCTRVILALCPQSHIGFWSILFWKQINHGIVSVSVFKLVILRLVCLILLDSIYSKKGTNVQNVSKHQGCLRNVLDVMLLVEIYTSIKRFKHIKLS